MDSVKSVAVIVMAGDEAAHTLLKAVSLINVAINFVDGYIFLYSQLDISLI